MKESRGRENRRYERVKVASCKNLWNLSEGGAYIITDSPKRLGSIFKFELRLGDEGKVFHSLAQVVRVLHKPNPKIGEPAGMAVKFLDPDPENLQLLRDFLKKQKEQSSKSE